MSRVYTFDDFVRVRELLPAQVSACIGLTNDQVLTTNSQYSMTHAVSALRWAQHRVHTGRDPRDIKKPQTETEIDEKALAKWLESLPTRKHVPWWVTPVLASARAAFGGGPATVPAYGWSMPERMQYHCVEPPGKRVCNLPPRTPPSNTLLPVASGALSPPPATDALDDPVCVLKAASSPLKRQLPQPPVLRFNASGTKARPKTHNVMSEDVVTGRQRAAYRGERNGFGFKSRVLSGSLSANSSNYSRHAVIALSTPEGGKGEVGRAVGLNCGRVVGAQAVFPTSATSAHLESIILARATTRLFFGSIIDGLRGESSEFQALVNDTGSLRLAKALLTDTADGEVLKYDTMPADQPCAGGSAAANWGLVSLSGATGIQVNVDTGGIGSLNARGSIKQVAHKPAKLAAAQVAGVQIMIQPYGKAYGTCTRTPRQGVGRGEFVYPRAAKTLIGYMRAGFLDPRHTAGNDCEGRHVLAVDPGCGLCVIPTIGFLDPATLSATYRSKGLDLLVEVFYVPGNGRFYVLNLHGEDAGEESRRKGEMMLQGAVGWCKSLAGEGVLKLVEPAMDWAAKDYYVHFDSDVLYSKTHMLDHLDTAVRIALAGAVTGVKPIHGTAVMACIEPGSGGYLSSLGDLCEGSRAIIKEYIARHQRVVISKEDQEALQDVFAQTMCEMLPYIQAVSALLQVYSPADIFNPVLSKQDVRKKLQSFTKKEDEESRRRKEPATLVLCMVRIDGPVPKSADSVLYRDQERIECLKKLLKHEVFSVGRAQRTNESLSRYHVDVDINDKGFIHAIRQQTGGRRIDLMLADWFSMPCAYGYDGAYSEGFINGTIPATFRNLGVKRVFLPNIRGGDFERRLADMDPVWESLGVTRTPLGKHEMDQNPLYQATLEYENPSNGLYPPHCTITANGEANSYLDPEQPFWVLRKNE